MGVPPAHLAFTRNTGHALSILADGLILEPGDNVVGVEGDYPAVIYPWKAQAWRGIETRLVPVGPNGAFTPADLDAAIDSRTRVVTLSWVQFGTGYRIDLGAFADLAHRRGALFIADLIQGLGALPVDTESQGVDAAASGVHKWLMAPSGTGGLYIAPHVLDRMRPVNIGADSVVDPFAYDSRIFYLKPTAHRFEEGSPNLIGLRGLDAALSLIEEVGIERIGERILSLTDHAADLLARKGYTVRSSREAAARSGLLLFDQPAHASASLLKILTDAGVAAALRAGRIRFSPHFYNTDAEIEAAVDALPA
jgi:selenocysteine lyase/cysteine desulfurase